MVTQTPTRIDAEAFFALPETLNPTELIEGELFQMPAPSPRHQRLVFKPAKLLDKLIPNGEVFIALNDVHLDVLNVVQPDVMWIAEGSACQETDKRFVGGAPDWVVEVLLDATTRRDRKEKFTLYEQHGTREYWLVDPQARLIEVWQAQDGRFGRVGAYTPEETFTSPLLEKPVGVAELF